MKISIQPHEPSHGLKWTYEDTDINLWGYAASEREAFRQIKRRVRKWRALVKSLGEAAPYFSEEPLSEAIIRRAKNAPIITTDPITEEEKGRSK